MVNNSQICIHPLDFHSTNHCYLLLNYALNLNKRCIYFLTPKQPEYPGTGKRL